MNFKRVNDFGPNDIITPIATLLGLLVVAVGFLHSTPIPGTEVKNLTDIILSITSVFILTVILSVGFLITGRRVLWSLSLRLYLVSWITLGLGMVVIFAILAYGNVTYYQVGPVSFNIIFLSAMAILFLVIFAVIFYENTSEYRFLLYLKGQSKIGKEPSNSKVEVEDLLSRNKGSYEDAFLKTLEDVMAVMTEEGWLDQGAKVPPNENTIQGIYSLKKVSDIKLKTKDALIGLVKLHRDLTSDNRVDDYVIYLGIKTCLTLISELETLRKKSAKTKT